MNLNYSRSGLKFKSAKFRRGSFLVEAVIAMVLLSTIALVLFKGTLNIIAPRQWSLSQNISDAYLTYEKAYAELKSGFAFACVPTHRYHANSAWQVFNILAFNLTRAFQVAAGAKQRTMNRKRTPLRRYVSIQTLRFNCINRAGLITRPQGRNTLDVGISPDVKAYFENIGQALQKAA